MDYLDQVASGIDYIELHLESDVVSSEVARHAGLSQWHFQRIFKALTGETLMGYVRGRRLANSLELLQQTDLRILDIALSAGYENQESFTRVFRQTFLVTPSEYRKIGKRAVSLKKVEINREYLEHIQSKVTLEPSIGQYPERRVVGKRTTFYGVDSERNNVASQLAPLWQAFLANLAEVPNTVAGVCYGVLEPMAPDDDRLSYLAGIEVDPHGELPHGLIERTIPCASYATFEHRGVVASLDNTVNYIYSSWLLRSGYRHTSGPDLEIYGKDYHPTSEASIIHYAIPIESASP